MKSLVPYLIFNGDCREAMQFYKTILEGNITKMQTIGESPIQAPDEAADRIFDSEMKSGSITIKASDSMPGQEISKSNQISLMIIFEDRTNQERIYRDLAKEGNVSFELTDQTGFAMLTDKFGVSWMLAFHP